MQTIWYQNDLIYRENVFKNFIVHIEAAARRKNKSRGVLHAKKAAFLFIDSFPAYRYVRKYIVTVLGIEKLIQKNWPEYLDYKIFM